MGNTCGGPAGPLQGACNGTEICKYRIFENPQTPDQYKINALLNIFCGFQTASDILTLVNNQAPIYGYGIVYVLMFPPALQYIYAVNKSVVNDGTNRVLGSDEYTLVSNPYWDQAQVIQSLMFGQTQEGSWPCVPSFSVPFSLQQSAGFVNFADISNPAYNQCLSAMYKQLETPQPKGNSLVCVDGVGATLPTISYSADLVSDQIMNNRKDILKCLTPAQGGTGDASQCSKVLFVQNNIGPYDTTTGQPCTNINDKTCTYSICSSTAPTGGWNCTSTGRCIQVSVGGTFPTLEACQQCQTLGTCPGSNVCCPEAQAPNYGTCSGTTTGGGTLPIPSSGYMKDALIGLGISAVVIILVTLLIMYLKRKSNSK